jgi:hypothetical protein
MVILKSDEEWESLSDAERRFDAIVDWWTDLRAKGKITAGAELAPPTTATTVSWDGTQPVVTDGPYLEAKETVGGFGILNVETTAEAIEIVCSWPSWVGIRIEVRPIVGS